MSRRGGRSARGNRAAIEAATRQRQRAESVATIRIESIAAGGDGVGRADGLACFVPRTAPGDVAQVALQTHARHARGRVLQLLEASPLRVEPTCRHYDGDRCGGCQLQHLNVDAQRESRLTIVQDALRRIGKRDVPRATLVSGEEWAYRGRLTLTLRPRGTTWVGGLHPYDDALRVFALEECSIAHPSLVEAWHAVRAQQRGLPKAVKLRVALRRVAPESVTSASSGAAASVKAAIAIVISGGASWPEAEAWGSALHKLHDAIAAVWWEREDGERVAIFGGGEVDAISGDWTASDVVADRDAIDVGPDATEALAFAQVNEEVAQALRTFVVEQVKVLSPTHAIDAYAGVGILSQLLASVGVRITAIEADEAGVSQARRRLANVPGARVVCDTVENALADLLPADVVVLNPPRRGVDIRVTALLADAAAQGVRGIVYVSCDPATLARDVARLASWRIAALRCFDMFPQTAHVETVCVLVPELA